jgi:hypothetical protein
MKIILTRISYEFYDLLKRLRYSVDGENCITEQRWDSLDRLIGKIRYGNRLPEVLLTKLKAGQDITLVPDTRQDAWWQYFYDLDDNTLAVQDPAGYVTLHVWESGHRCIEKVQFTTKSDHLPHLSDILPQASAKDVHTYYTYNARSACCLEGITTEGKSYVTAYGYYPNGKVHTTKRYETPLTEKGQGWEVLQLPPDAANDQLKVYTYDLLARIVQIQLPFDQLNVQAFDTMGHLVLACTYDAKAPQNNLPDFKRSIIKVYD